MVLQKLYSYAVFDKLVYSLNKVCCKFYQNKNLITYRSCGLRAKHSKECQNEPWASLL